jgi:hypothetical protein
MRVRQEGTERHRERTGPATHTPKSLAAGSWPSRPYRASGQPSCGKSLHRRQDALGVAGSRADTGGGAYKSTGMRIARSDGGTRPSSRFPNSSLQRSGSCASLLRRSSKRRGRAAVGGAQARERGQRGDRRRHAAEEAVLADIPALQRARSARARRPGDRTGGGRAYSATSLVSAVMLATIGPVKSFFIKRLIAHSEACGCAEDGPPTRSRCARAAMQAPRRRRARPREGDAHGSERGQRGDRRRHAAGEAVLAEVPAPQRASAARASRPGDRTGGGAAYR